MPEQRFRKRPVEVAAIQWTGDNEAEIQAWCGGANFSAHMDGDRYDREITAEVWDELHLTWVGVKTGDWIVRGVRNEFYPINPEVLAATYDRVEAVGAS